jgi:hypothetical protein
MKLTITFKIRLFEHCKNEIERRVANFEYAMMDAQASANSEDKSSAGDKYETGRAMSQIARDMNVVVIVVLIYFGSLYLLWSNL